MALLKVIVLLSESNDWTEIVGNACTARKPGNQNFARTLCTRHAKPQIPIWNNNRRRKKTGSQIGPNIHTHTHTHTEAEKRKRSPGWTNSPAIHLFIYSGAAWPLCCQNAVSAHAKTRWWGASEGGFRCCTLCEVSLGYDRLVPALAGLLTVAKRRVQKQQKETPIAMHSVKANYLALGGRGAR